MGLKTARMPQDSIDWLEHGMWGREGVVSFGGQGCMGASISYLANLSLHKKYEECRKTIKWSSQSSLISQTVMDWKLPDAEVLTRGSLPSQPPRIAHASRQASKRVILKTHWRLLAVHPRSTSHRHSMIKRLVSVDYFFFLRLLFAMVLMIAKKAVSQFLSSSTELFARERWEERSKSLGQNFTIFSYDWSTSWIQEKYGFSFRPRCKDEATKIWVCNSGWMYVYFSFWCLKISILLSRSIFMSRFRSLGWYQDIRLTWNIW